MQCIWSLIVTAGSFFIDPTSTVVIDSFTTTAELSCNVSQVPDGLVRYKWTIANNGQTLQPSVTHKKYHVRTKAIDSETQSLTLKILDLNHSDAGKYICGAVEEEEDDDDEDDDNLVAVNGTVCLILQGEVSCVLLHVDYIVANSLSYLILVIVYTASLNVGQFSVMIYSVASSVQLSCDMAGYVPVQSDLQWYRNGMMLQNSTKYTILYQGGNRSAVLPSGPGASILSVLVINNPHVEDSGEYECRIVSLGIKDIALLTVVNQIPVTATTTTPVPISTSK